MLLSPSLRLSPFSPSLSVSLRFLRLSPSLSFSPCLFPSLSLSLLLSCVFLLSFHLSLHLSLRVSPTLPVSPRLSPSVPLSPLSPPVSSFLLFSYSSLLLSPSRSHPHPHAHTGVPTFLIGGKFVTSGAAHARELVNIFRKIENSGLGAPESLFAGRDFQK